jgi:glutaconate CoA-transferase, subunit B
MPPDTTATGYTATEIMTIVAARRLKDGTVCFVGIGMPSAAANLARLTHAPEVVLIYESGTIGAKPDVLPLSIGDGELAEHADTVVSIPEIFRYWLQGGRVDVGFLGAAQVDRFGNINTTVIGSYDKPKVRLPGAGGAPEIASNARETWIIIKQTKRSFVPKLDFMTSVGHLEGGDSRARSGARGKGPTAVITDMGVLTPDPVTRELTLTALHPGITVEQAKANTGWDLKVAANLATTQAPTAQELEVLRDLQARTAKAHGTVSSE